VKPLAIATAAVVALATTGVSIPPYVIPGSIGIVVIGAILLVVTRLRRRRDGSG
jgi:hypothetical protein